MSEKAVGVREIAAAAGVSRQTVSRVLNDHPSIRPETRQRVLDVMDRYSYRPNRAARALGTNRSGILGVVCAIGVDRYGPSASLEGISQAAAASDLVVNTVYVPEASATALAQAVEAQLDFLVDGLLFIAPQRRTLRVIGELGVRVPYVMLQAGDLPSPHAFAIDQEWGARLATRHLLEQGHRSIAHVAGPQEWLEADARMRGFLAEMSDWDADPLPPILGGWTAEAGYEVGQHLARRRDITAVFASNDAAAVGVLHALHEAGVRVPRDVSVVGFDDSPGSEHAWPPLTTIRQDFGELGRLAVARLIGQHSDDGPPAPVLVVRASTGPVSTR